MASLLMELTLGFPLSGLYKTMLLPNSQKHPHVVYHHTLISRQSFCLKNGLTILSNTHASNSYTVTIEFSDFACFIILLDRHEVTAPQGTKLCLQLKLNGRRQNQVSGCALNYVP